MLVSQGIIIKYLSGGGGGGIDVYTKKHGRTTRAAWDRMLYQDPCIWRIDVYTKKRAYHSGSVGQDALPGPLHLTNWRVHQKARAYNSGSVGQDALPGPLHLLVQIVAIPPKILKWPEKKKPNFYSPPPPTHTYLWKRNTQRIGIWKMLPIRGYHPHHPKHKICPLIPPQKYIRPPYALPPPPLRALP